MAWAYKSSAGKRSKKDGKERGNKDKWKQRFVRASNNPEPHVWWFKSDKVGFAHVLLTLDCRLRLGWTFGVCSQAWEGGKPPMGEMTLQNAQASYEPAPEHKGEFIVHVNSCERHLKMRVGALAAAAEWKATIEKISGAEEVLEAATKLQAVQRGRQERQQRVKESGAALKIQQLQRGKAARREVDTMRNRTVLDTFAPTSPLDCLCLELLSKRQREAAAAGKKQLSFERLALKFPTFAEVFTPVKMIFDVSALSEAGITLTQLQPTLSSLGIEMSHDDIAAVFAAPGVGGNVYRDSVGQDECTEYLTFAVRKHPPVHCGRTSAQANL